MNAAIAGTYRAGANTRRIRGALQPLLKAAPLSKSAVSRVVGTLKDGLAAWRTRPLGDVDAIFLYLDGFALRQAESLSPSAATEESMSPETQWQVAGSAAENYETYLVPVIFGSWGRDLLDVAALNPGERVLDVARGTGIIARIASETDRAEGGGAGAEA